MLLLLSSPSLSSISPHRGAGLTIPTRCDQYPKGVGVLPEDLPELLARGSANAWRPFISFFPQKSKNRRIVYTTVRFLGQNVEKPCTFIKFSSVSLVNGITFGDSGGKMSERVWPQCMGNHSKAEGKHQILCTTVGFFG